MDFLFGLCYYYSQIFDMAWFIFSGWLDTPMAIVGKFGQEKH